LFCVFFFSYANYFSSVRRSAVETGFYVVFFFFALSRYATAHRGDVGNALQILSAEAGRKRVKKSKNDLNFST